MAIGIDDDFEDFDESLEENTLTEDTEIVEDSPQDSSEDNNSEDDIISQLLKDRGIIDSSKIKFEGDDGEIEEHSWDSLSLEDKLGILRDNPHEDSNNDVDLDDSEIELINTIRQNKMSPEEYINYIQRQGVDNYLQNVQTPQYSVDDIDDDTLFILDLIAKVGDENITDEEAENLLSTAKSNEQLFKKQVDAIRNDYKQREDNERMQFQEAQQQQQIEQFNRFAESVENEIRNFSEIGNFELNMDESEMEELYDFITGHDAAGVSFFGKALNDPQLLVKMAWFALNGEQAIQDINDYWTNELKNTRNKVKTPTSQVQIKTNLKKQHTSTDIDDDF